MIVLLSPAKTLDETPTNGLPTTQPWFEDDTRTLLEYCRRLSADDLKSLMKINDSLAELNHDRFQALSFPFSKDNAKPAVLTFKGDVYRTLDAASLSQDDLLYAQDHLRILSGFYGLLRPLDLMQPYRLEMGTRLATDRGANLYDFWGTRLVERINQEYQQRPFAAVLNLASNEYFKAVPTEHLAPPLIQASFKEIRDGQPKTIAIYAKKARGSMARFQIRNRIEDPEGLKDFAEDGYALDSTLSTDSDLVFVR